MKTIYIKDLQKAQIFTGEVFAIFEVKRLQDKNGNTYLDLLIGDKTGKLRAKVWSDTLQSISTKMFKEDTLLSFSGKVDEYKGVLQRTIMSVSQVDEQALDDFINSSLYDVEQMWKDLQTHIKNIENTELKNFLTNLFENPDIARKYKYWPAAKTIHHEFRSGLLQHVLEMIDIANGMRKFYQDINFDIVIGGIILHDIGKLEELSAEGIATSYTKKGTLLGHISIGAEMLDANGGTDLPEDLYIHLKHIILSHHGELQFGSPVTPSTPEAFLVSQIDVLSSKARTSLSYMAQITDDSEFTNYIPFLNNTKIWNTSKANYSHNQEESQNSDADKNSLKNTQDSDQLTLV